MATEPAGSLVVVTLLGKLAKPGHYVVDYHAETCSCSDFETTRRRCKHKNRRKQTWVKTHALVGNETNIITAIVVTDGHINDSPEMPGLVERTAERFTIEKVEGDKAYLSHANLQAIEAVGATPYIPFKVNSTSHGSAGGAVSEAWKRMWHMFSAIKRLFGAFRLAIMPLCTQYGGQTPGVGTPKPQLAGPVRWIVSPGSTSITWGAGAIPLASSSPLLLASP